MPEHRFTMITPHGDPLGRMGEPDVGGQCVYIRELSAHLAKAGHEVRIYTRDRGEGKPPSEPIVPGATVMRIPCGPPEFIPKEELGPYLDVFADRVNEDLVGGELIHSHYWDGGYVAGRLRGDRPWFHTTHSIGKLKRAALPEGSQYRYDDRIRIETDIYRDCDCVIALTSTERDQIAELYDVPAGRIAVIPPGVNSESFTPPPDRTSARARFDLPEGACVVFTLGRLDERKGFDLFLRAAGRLARRQELPETVFLFSAGNSGGQEAKEREKLERIVTEERLGSRLRWLPILPEEELPSAYGASDIFVLPSRYEPFGIVMLEAMACAVPVVATREGGPATVIEPGVTGFLVDPTDAEAMASAMEELVRDPEQRRRFGQRGRQVVEANYSWRIIAERHVTAYERCAKEGEHAGG